MEQAFKDSDLVDFLVDEYTLLDSSITEFRIYKQNEIVCIDVTILLITNKKKLLMTFKDIIEYYLVYQMDFSFYNVELYKFFYDDMGAYISFDPIDMSNEISESDTDFIRSKNVTGYIIDWSSNFRS